MVDVVALGLKLESDPGGRHPKIPRCDLLWEATPHHHYWWETAEAAPTKNGGCTNYGRLPVPGHSFLSGLHPIDWALSLLTS
eukprot:scaffold2434_cov70-Cyclotella_meneghiniana.AAC.7